MSQRRPIAASAVVSAPFIVCLLVLAGAAVGKEMLVRWAGGAMRKEPIPLRKPLETLDRGKLGDYRVIDSFPMTASVEAALGTDQYIDWAVEDTTITSQTDPRRYAHLTVTYYTGTQDPVPHIAEVCYLGGGYMPKQAHDKRDIETPALRDFDGKVPVQICTFIKTAIHNKQEPTVVYTFNANGEFAADRESVRYTTTNLLTKHAYFSKVEVSFGGSHCRPPNLGREESVAAAARLFNVILPILVEEHWPDWKAIEQSGNLTTPPGS